MLVPEPCCFGNLGGHFGSVLKNAALDDTVISGEDDGLQQRIGESEARISKPWGIGSITEKAGKT